MKKQKIISVEQARINQNKIELNGHWELIAGDFKEYYKFVPNEKINERPIGSEKKVPRKESKVLRRKNKRSRD